MKDQQLLQPNRRAFLGRVGVAGAATIAAGVIGVEPLFQTGRSEAHAATGPNQRANDCAKLRRDAAAAGLKETPQNLQHPNNQDENLYPNKLGSYSKGLPHNDDGTVVLSAYKAVWFQKWFVHRRPSKLSTQACPLISTRSQSQATCV